MKTENYRVYRNPAKRTLQERVRKSALRLDTEVPNWHQKIDVNVLDMGTPKKCICGQLQSKMGFEAFQKTKLYDLDIGRGFYNPSTAEIGSGSNRMLSMWRYQIKKRKQIDAMFRV